jgi:hypothetical protein
MEARLKKCERMLELLTQELERDRARDAGARRRPLVCPRVWGWPPLQDWPCAACVRALGRETVRPIVRLRCCIAANTPCPRPSHSVSTPFALVCVCFACVCGFCAALIAVAPSGKTELVQQVAVERAEAADWLMRMLEVRVHAVPCAVV